MTKNKQSNTNRPIGNRNICGSDNDKVLEKSNVNIVHSNTSSYNFVIGAALITVMLMVLALSGFMFYSAVSYKSEINKRLDAQDIAISNFLTNR